MVNAVVLLRMKHDRINEDAQSMADFDGVTAVYSVAGQYDLVVMARVKDNEALAELVTGRILKLPGILSSETLIAFRVLSRYDLDGIFSVGMDA